MTLGASPRPLVEEYDAALLDLDGVVYAGRVAIPCAAETLRRMRDLGMRRAFVTNNASRTPEAVAEHLRELGIDAAADDVVTSAQAAARVVADRLPPGSPVLAVGGPGVPWALDAAGLRPVRTADEAPLAVVQGYGPDVRWADLAEATVAVRAGALWVSTNGDLTLPSEGGPIPGNGSIVRAVAAALGRGPDLVAGKPETPLQVESMRRVDALHPLVVGDRLDTDIAGARRVGVDSLLVLTGVTTALDALLAGPEWRPSYVGADVAAVLQAHPRVETVDAGARCGAWVAEVTGEDVAVRVVPDVPRGDPLDGVRAALVAGWAAADAGSPVRGIVGVQWPAA